MSPILFQTDGFFLPTYGVFYLVAFLAGIGVAAWQGTRVGMPFWRTVDLGLLMAIAGEVGARLTFLMVEWERFSSGDVSWPEFLVGGRVLMGGIATALLVITVYLLWKSRDVAVPVFLDLAFTGAALGVGIGRIGCLMAGCCFGRETGAWWGLTFTDPAARLLNGTPLNTPLHPTQILQSISAFVLFLLLLWLFPRRRFGGQSAGVFLVFSGAVRFLVEFLRGDPRGEQLGLSASQWIGLGFVAVGAILLLWMWRRRYPSGPAVLPAA